MDSRDTSEGVDRLTAALGVLLDADAATLLEVNGDEDPGEGTSEEGPDCLGVLHAERDTLGLPDAERRTKLVPGVLGFDVLGLMGGKSSEDGGDDALRVPMPMDDADAMVLLLSGLMLNLASAGLGRKRGETWTL